MRRPAPGRGDGRLALGATSPYARVAAESEAAAPTPRGIPLAVGKSGAVTAYGDPALAAPVVWKHRDGDLFRAGNVYSALIIAVGSCGLGWIANLWAKRWGLGLGSAFAMGNFKRGREPWGMLGVTRNGENEDTDDRSGTDLHLEPAYPQHLPTGLAVGVAGYRRRPWPGNTEIAGCSIPTWMARRRSWGRRGHGRIGATIPDARPGQRMAAPPLSP